MEAEAYAGERLNAVLSVELGLVTYALDDLRGGVRSAAGVSQWLLRRLGLAWPEACSGGQRM